MEISPLDHTLPDGRTLTGGSIGPLNGRPVLFIAGAGTGKTMHFGAELLAELGVRLLTMDRPGMGGSSPDPMRDTVSTAVDYLAFAAAAGAAGPTVVANSQGALFGLALAATGDVPRLVLASPVDELAFPATHAQLPAEATALADIAEADPDAAADVLLGFSADGLLRMILNGACESDRAVYEAPEFARRFDAALAEGFADPEHGYVRDTMLALRPWQLRLDAIAAPVDVLFGENDGSHSPDLGATLSRRITGSERVVLRDAGAALLWTHSREVLERAIR